MSIKIEWKGKVFTTSTPEEAVRLAVLLDVEDASRARGDTPRIGRTRTTTTPSEVASQASDDLEKVIRFLSLLDSDGEVDGKALGVALDVDSRKIGPAVRAIKKCLRDSGFEPQKIFSSYPTPSGYTAWSARPGLASALEAMKARSGGDA